MPKNGFTIFQEPQNGFLDHRSLGFLNKLTKNIRISWKYIQPRKFNPITFHLKNIFSSQYLTNNENIFIFQTDKDTDNYKLIAIDICSPDPIKSAKDFVAENKKDKLEYAYAVHDKYMVLSYTQDVKVCLEKILM